MATYQISSQTTVPQLKDSLIGQTLYSTAFNSNLAQQIDLTVSDFATSGAQNNNAHIKYDNTLLYSFNHNPLSYTPEYFNHYSSVITITNDTTQFRLGNFDFYNNIFTQKPTYSTYSLLQDTTIITFAPQFPMVYYNG